MSLQNTVIHSEVYGQPPNATQKAGPFPLGESLNEPEETLNSDDDRMEQAVFSNGLLWGGLTTIVSDGSQNNAGIAYFAVVPAVRFGKLRALILGQSYVSVKGASIIYPAVAVTKAGLAAVAYTLSGPSYFPSAAFTYLTPFFGLTVNVVAAGAAPTTTSRDIRSSAAPGMHVGGITLRPWQTEIRSGSPPSIFPEA